MTVARLSMKDVRPATTKPCHNAPRGCRNQADITGPGTCPDCRRGKPIPALTGAAALLAEVQAGVKRYTRDDSIKALAKLFGPTTLDRATQLTLDRLYTDDFFTDELRTFVKEGHASLNQIGMVAHVGYYTLRRAASGQARLAPEQMLRVAEAMLILAELDPDDPHGDEASAAGGTR